MSITLINPPEKKRVWAGIAESMSYGVYCFPPLALMYLQAAIEKRTSHKAEVFDAIVTVARQSAGMAPRPAVAGRAAGSPPPHLTEAWYCCAEPGPDIANFV